MLEGFSFKLRKARPMRVGLTGSLASGKSTVLKVFRKSGWAVLSADEVVAKIYQDRGITKDWILKRFGNSEAGMKRLEKWIHPLVGRRVWEFLARSKGVAIVEVPLLFEAKFDQYFDLNISVFAPRADRLRRVVKRGMPRKLFEKLDARQMSPAEKAKRADFVLHNYVKRDLKKQSRFLADFLKGISRGN